MRKWVAIIATECERLLFGLSVLLTACVLLVGCGLLLYAIGIYAALMR